MDLGNRQAATRWLCSGERRDRARLRNCGCTAAKGTRWPGSLLSQAKIFPVQSSNPRVNGMISCWEEAPDIIFLEHRAHTPSSAHLTTACSVQMQHNLNIGINSFVNCIRLVVIKQCSNELRNTVCFLFEQKSKRKKKKHSSPF